MSPGWPFIRLFLPAAAAAALAGCVGTTALSRLDQARALGGPFSQALFKNYTLLARSFGTVGTPSSGTPFDANNSIQLGGMNASVADIANGYAQKALATAQGEEILPEPSDPEMAGAEAARLQLLRDLDQGRDKTPERAARAQADFDCWMMNARSEELVRAARECHRSFSQSIAALERDLAAATAPPPAPPPPAASPAAPPPAAETSPAQPAPETPPPQPTH
jgi:signal transduction histidine kinase